MGTKDARGVVCSLETLGLSGGIVLSIRTGLKGLVGLIFTLDHIRNQRDTAQCDAVLDQGDRHDDACDQDDHKQYALVELGLCKLRIGALNLEEQEDGDEASRRDVKQRENSFALEQQQADETNTEEYATDDEPFCDDMQVGQ